MNIRREDGFCFTIHEAYARVGESLARDLEAIGSRPGVETVKRNRVRTVYRVEVDGVALFLKQYHSPGAQEALKSLVRPSRAAAEWRAMHALRAAGIPTAEPVLYGERRRRGVLQAACFAATAIEDAEDFGRFVKRLRAEERWSRSFRKELYRALARLTADLHAAGIRHGDYHPGNILCRSRPSGPPDLFVVDLHTVTFPRRLSRRARLLNLARIAEVLEGLDGGWDLDYFLGRYMEAVLGFADSVEDLRREIDRITARLQERKYRSRTRRCMLVSSEFTPAVQDGLRMHLRRSYGGERIAEALAVHDTVATQGDRRLLHPVLKNKVTVVEVDGPEGKLALCVKEYRRLSILERLFPVLFSEARRAWIAGRGLEIRGITTPETAAWVRTRDREFLVTRYIAGTRRLHRYIEDRCRNLPPREAAALQRALSRELAAFVAAVHAAGVRHRDLSEQNILVAEEEGRRRYYLIDCDTVRFSRRVRRRERVKNLVQLGHMPEDVNVVAKARFLQHYLEGRRGDEWRAFFRAVNRGVLKRMEKKRRKFARRGDPDPHPRPSRFRRSW